MTSFSSAWLKNLFRFGSLTATKFLFFNNYCLEAKINHLDSFNNRHYLAIVKHGNTNQWFSCNYKVVLQIWTDDLSNKTLYVIFFVRKWFSLFFLLFSYKGALSIETLSLGVTTPHITPGLYRYWVCSLNFQV